MTSCVTAVTANWAVNTVVVVTQLTKQNFVKRRDQTPVK